MSTKPEALRLAETTDSLRGGNWSDQAAAELRRLHEENERLKTVPMKYRRMEFNAQLQEENSRLHTLNAELVKAYRKMYNAAAGYSNYCEDSASVRRCERDFEEADAIFRAAIARTTGEQ